MTHNGQIVTALLLTTLAGLATTIGSLIGVYYREPGPRYMSFTLGFSAGVMILVSFVELLAQAVDTLGFSQAHLAFFIGIALMFVIDLALPHLYILEDPYEGKKELGEEGLKKTALLIAIGIGIHNFPEGMATLAGTLKDVNLGIAMAVAVGIHNIPEGIAVAVPIFAVTRSARKAFKWSFISGLSEPVGAIVALLILMPFLTETVLGWMLAMVAGFMVFISLDELLPAANAYGKEHLAISGVVVGMAVMAISLALLV